MLVDSALFRPLPAGLTPDSLAAAPLKPLATTTAAAATAGAPVEYEPVGLDAARTPWEARVVAATNDHFPGEGKHYITLFVRCVVADEAAQPRVMEAEKCAGWTWRSWKEIREFDGPLFTPLVALLQQFGEDHDVFKAPVKGKDVLL